MVCRAFEEGVVKFSSLESLHLPHLFSLSVADVVIDTLDCFKRQEETDARRPT